MNSLFAVVGDSLFSPLASTNKEIYLDCLVIIYDSYRRERSFGVDRDAIIQKLTYYFEDHTPADAQDIASADAGPAAIQDAAGESLRDPRALAAEILRRLIGWGWVQRETGSDQREKIVMPGYAVSILRTLIDVAEGRETEYQSELAAIYSLLNNPELMEDPYPQVVKPVYDRTLALFTGLKQLNTDIKAYIERLTANQSAEEIVKNFVTYSEHIGSQAYHRLLTSDNVSRFRNNILEKLDEIRFGADKLEKVAWGYQRVENQLDLAIARDESRRIINDIADYFNSYDTIVDEITEKHHRYLNSTVRRARFLLTNSNNTEGKISKILEYLAELCNAGDDGSPETDLPEDLCALFSIFPQGFYSAESLYTVPISRKIADVDDLVFAQGVSPEEREEARMRLYARNASRFSRANITRFVHALLKEKPQVQASELPLGTRRDMIRLIFVSLYGQVSRAEYTVEKTGERINANGFIFDDFIIRSKDA